MPYKLNMTLCFRKSKTKLEDKIKKPETLEQRHVYTYHDAYNIKNAGVGISR